MEKDDLRRLYEFQTRRLESELVIHWQRIQILSVGLIGIITATGYLLLQTSCSSAVATVQDAVHAESWVLYWLTITSLGFVWLLSWYLVVLTISGSFWIRVNEQKLGVIEKLLFGTEVYGAFLRDGTRPVSLTLFTKVFFAIIGSIGLFLLVLNLLRYFVSREPSMCMWVVDGAEKCWLWIIPSLICLSWFYIVVMRQSKRVFGRPFRHIGGHRVINRTAASNGDVEPTFLEGQTNLGAGPLQMDNVLKRLLETNAPPQQTT